MIFLDIRNPDSSPLLNVVFSGKEEFRISPPFPPSFVIHSDNPFFFFSPVFYVFPFPLERKLADLPSSSVWLLSTRHLVTRE